MTCSGLAPCQGGYFQLFDRMTKDTALSPCARCADLFHPSSRTISLPFSLSRFLRHPGRLWSFLGPLLLIPGHVHFPSGLFWTCPALANKLPARSVFCNTPQADLVAFISQAAKLVCRNCSAVVCHASSWRILRLEWSQPEIHLIAFICFSLPLFLALQWLSSFCECVQLNEHVHV